MRNEKNPGYSITRSLAMNLQDRGAIVVTKGDAIGSIFRIRDNKEITLGRNPMTCDLVIHGKRISRIHCTIEYRSDRGKYRVVDKSSNGCFTKDFSRLKKNEEYELPSGTEIMLGDEENIVKLG